MAELPSGLPVCSHVYPKLKGTTTQFPRRLIKEKAEVRH
jgi:hypothetical protein